MDFEKTYVKDVYGSIAEHFDITRKYSPVMIPEIISIRVRQAPTTTTH